MDLIIVVLASMLIFSAIVTAFYLGKSMSKRPQEYKKFQAGEFLIDMTDPMDEVLSINLTCNLLELLDQDEVYFKIINKSSQEKPLA